jgi:hypothetical protein
VRQWRYKPTLINGRAVEVDTHITVIYQLYLCGFYWGVVCQRLGTREELKSGSQPLKRQPPKKSRNYFSARPGLLNPATRSLFGSPCAAAAVQ